jgi:hypothetical protein
LSWCDKLASVPGVGLQLDFHFASSGEILAAMSPILDKLIRDNKPTFSIQKPDTFDVIFSTEDGFQYALDASRVSVSFKHQMRLKEVSGGPPTMELLSSSAPFTKLLPIVSSQLIHAALLLPAAKQRKINRIGIISTTSVAEEDIPPGIQKFIEYIGKPWTNKLDTFNVAIASKLGEESGWSDRCIHTIAKPEGQDQLLNINFDWQRTFKSGRPISESYLKELTANAESAALDYFEKLAEGSMFDAEIIGGTNNV